MYRTLCLTLLLAFIAGTPSLALAQSSGYADERPRRGMSMSAVERTYGSPVSKRAAVGDPPITRWIYGDFTVYFEHDRVIHAVVNRVPPPARS